MEATLEIATHFRDGTNLVGAEIAPELNYLWIVYWSKNRTPLGKFESYREDSLIRLLSNTWQLIFTCFTWHYEEKTLDSQNSEGTCYAIITSNVHTDRCAVFWQPRTFTVRSDVHRQVDNLRAVAKKNIFWHRKPLNSDALVISVETNHLTERCSVTWHRAKWSNFWVRFLAVI